MKLLQAGVAKSGNYWLYSILQSILRRSGLPTHTYIETQPIYPVARQWELSYPEQASIDTIDITVTGVSYRISSIFKWPVQDIDSYLTRATHVWTHSEVCDFSASVFPKFDKIVYIVWDPRDVALSQSKFMFTPYMQTYYPTSFKTPEEFLAARLHKLVAHWREHVAGHLAAAARQWVEKLNERQKAAALAQAGPLLTLLNYPRQMDGLDADLPLVPVPLDEKRVVSAGRAPAPPRSLKSVVRRAARRLLG